jgi:hypothetical protein
VAVSKVEFRPEPIPLTALSRTELESVRPERDNQDQSSKGSFQYISTCPHVRYKESEHEVSHNVDSDVKSGPPEN